MTNALRKELPTDGILVGNPIFIQAMEGSVPQALGRPAPAAGLDLARTPKGPSEI